MLKYQNTQEHANKWQLLSNTSFWPRCGHQPSWVSVFRNQLLFVDCLIFCLRQSSWWQATEIKQGWFVQKKKLSKGYRLKRWGNQKTAILEDEPQPTTKWCEQDRAFFSIEHSVWNLYTWTRQSWRSSFFCFPAKYILLCSPSLPKNFPQFLHLCSSILGHETRSKYVWLTKPRCMPSLTGESWKQVSGIFRFCRWKKTWPVSKSHKVKDCKITGKRFSCYQPKIMTKVHSIFPVWRVIL